MEGFMWGSSSSLIDNLRLVVSMSIVEAFPLRKSGRTIQARRYHHRSQSVRSQVPS